MSNDTIKEQEEYMHGKQESEEDLYHRSLRIVQDYEARQKPIKKTPIIVNEGDTSDNQVNSIISDIGLSFLHWMFICAIYITWYFCRIWSLTCLLVDYPASSMLRWMENEFGSYKGLK